MSSEDFYGAFMRLLVKSDLPHPYKLVANIYAVIANIYNEERLIPRITMISRP